MNIHNTPSRRQQTQYLVAYNLVCAVLWTAVLGRLMVLIPLVGFHNVHGGVGEFTKWTQTLALLEVVHSALGRLIHCWPQELLVIVVGSEADNLGTQVLSAHPSSPLPCKFLPAYSSFGPW